jgi:catechol 2,3-dioxygenase-like lactoylglutathione lyase family enzyme
MPEAPQLSVSGLNHLTLAVAELDRSLAFYVDLLGCDLVARWKQGAYLECGNLWLCLSVGTVSNRADYTHFALSVDAGSMANWRVALDKACVPHWKVNTSEGDSVYIRDPDGHQLELHTGSLATRLKALEQNPYDEMKYRWRS